MATTDHKGMFVTGDIVGYDTYSGGFYGFKLLKEVYVDEVAGYRWIGQDGKAPKDATAFSGNTNLTLLSEKEINSSYPKKWTAEPVYKKGDILVGKTGTGKTLLFVYISDTHVERLTPRPDMSSVDQFGYSTLTDYNGNFGPLTVHKTQRGVGLSGINKKFSEI